MDAALQGISDGLADKYKSFAQKPGELYQRQIFANPAVPFLIRKRNGPFGTREGNTLIIERTRITYWSGLSDYYERQYQNLLQNIERIGKQRSEDELRRKRDHVDEL
jgi:hypothetical protein